MKKPRLTPDQKDQIRKRYESGESMAKIAKAFGCSSSTVCYAVNSESKSRARVANEEWKRANPERYKEAKDRWYQEVKDDPAFKSERSAYAARYYLENRGDVIQRTGAYAKANPERRLATLRRYYKNNPHAAARNCAKRRASKLQATPPWLTAEHWAEIEATYEQAAFLSAETGIKHEVDHIDPLQGETVCGLHVPWNLQVLPRPVNRSKSNKLVS